MNGFGNMSGKIIIGLEAHDATGKSETSEVLARIFGGSIYKVSDEMKSERRQACEPIDIFKKFTRDSSPESDEYNLEIFEKACNKMDESYSKESEIINKIRSNFIVMDRTWASHAAERYYQSRINGHENEYLDEKEENILWPKNVIKPDITFEMKLVPDSKRVERMTERAEEEGVEIKPREEKLNSDEQYRWLLEIARKKLGCRSFVFREKRPQEVCALRISQSILGSFDCPPMDTNLKHL